MISQQGRFRESMAAEVEVVLEEWRKCQRLPESARSLEATYLTFCKLQESGDLRSLSGKIDCESGLVKTSRADTLIHHVVNLVQLFQVILSEYDHRSRLRDKYKYK